jgi:hypothetical protein
MTRDDYINDRLNAAKAQIRASVAANGKTVSDWDQSWAADSIFPEIYWGMLAEAYGAIWDTRQEVYARDQKIEEHRLKINEIIRNYNLLVPLFGTNYGLQEVWELPS